MSFFKNPFKVGDRVVVTFNRPGLFNKEGTVTAIVHDYVDVDIPGFYDGGPPRLHYTSLALAQPTGSKFKVGDKVCSSRADVKGNKVITDGVVTDVLEGWPKVKWTVTVEEFVRPEHVEVVSEKATPKGYDFKVGDYVQATHRRARNYTIQRVLGDGLFVVEDGSTIDTKVGNWFLIIRPAPQFKVGDRVQRKDKRWGGKGRILKLEESVAILVSDDTCYMTAIEFSNLEKEL